MLNPSVHSDDARFLELLERWLTGDFTRSDEGELHALATADPFRREAWEGFSALPETEHQVQLERLRRRILERPARRIPLSRWMAAAAVLLLLLAAFYFIPDWQNGQVAQPMAQSKEPAANAPEPAKPTNDMLAAKDELPAVQPAPSATVSPKGDVFAADDQRSAEKEAAASSEEKVGASDAEVFNPSRAAKAKTRSAPGPVRIGGPETALQTQFRPETIPMTPETKQRIQEMDRLVGGPAANAVFPSDTTNKTLGLAGPIALDKAESPPAKPASDDAKKDSESSAARKKAPATPSQMAEPAGGWDAFHLFIFHNARLPEAALNHNVSGKVRLQFTVGPDFKPIHIQVLQALGYGCEAEAKRLIDLFTWGPPGASVVVELPFVR